MPRQALRCESIFSAPYILMEGYCVKCRKTREILGAEERTAKNGRKMMCGKCAECGTKMTKFVAGK
jgi:hypothetical protein